MARLAVAALTLVGTASGAQAPGLAVLKGVRAGQWHLAADDGRTRSVCVADMARLFQLRSRTGRCARFVVEDGARSGTVEYTCPGLGHGRTTITAETAQLLRIESQGIHRGAPFDLSIEARRMGNCVPPPRTVR